MRTELTTPRGNPAVLHVRDGTSDLAVAGSVFAGVAGSPLVDEYHLRDTRITGRFVDVGAHIGTVTIAVLLDNPDATAVCVEPIPDNIEMIRTNLEANGLTHRAEIIAGAAGTDSIGWGWTGSDTLETNRYIGNLSGGAGGSWIAVRRVTLADLLPCDALKLDCEGGEWALLADPAIASVPLIFGEFHGSPYGELRKTLRTSHRVVIECVDGDTGNFRAVQR